MRLILNADQSAADVIGSNENAFDDSLTNIIGIGASIGPAIQRVTNQVAMLEAQNSDIAGSRFTLNNLAAQWDAMTPNSKAMMAAAAIGVVYVLTHRG